MNHALARQTVDHRLQGLGWVLPSHLKYKGVNANHIVVCIKCGHLHEKRLNNLFHRNETCPICNDPKQRPIVVYDTQIKQLINSVEKFQKTIETELFGQRKNGNINTVPTVTSSQIHSLTKQLNKYISEVGRKQLKVRRLTTPQWEDFSQKLCMELIEKVIPQPQQQSVIEQIKLWKQNKPSSQLNHILPHVLPVELYPIIQRELTVQIVNVKKVT